MLNHTQLSFFGNLLLMCILSADNLLHFVPLVKSTFIIDNIEENNMALMRKKIIIIYYELVLYDDHKSIFHHAETNR